MASFLKIVVNGEEIFFVDKEILASNCIRINRLLSKNSNMEKANQLQLSFKEFPGGSEAFELITRFCYNNNKLHSTPLNFNFSTLHCAAHFMEFKALMNKTEKSLDAISYYMWSEIINSLKQCQNFISIAISSGLLDKLLDCLIEKIMTQTDSSPTSSSPDSSGFRFSFETRSTLSAKLNHHKVWWFEDLASLNLEVVEKAIQTMVRKKFEHVYISKFLFYYLKVNIANSTSQEVKKRTIETVVRLLQSLDKSALPYKNLLEILRVSSSQNLNKASKSMLESLIGSQMDQVVLDNLLVQAPLDGDCLYDVDIVMRFLKHFLDSGGRDNIIRLKKVGILMDLYLMEIAPDSRLKPSKFLELATVLPTEARDSYDDMYRAIDIYLQVHNRLSEEEKMKICCAINYEKLSSESCKHLTSNSKFPSRSTIQALASQHCKLKRLLKTTNNITPVQKRKDLDNEPIIVYSKKLNLPTENERLRAKLEKMQWKVMELENVCKKMQFQMTRMSKNGKMSSRHTKSLPRMCSGCDYFS